MFTLNRHPSSHVITKNSFRGILIILTTLILISCRDVETIPSRSAFEPPLARGGQITFYYRKVTPSNVLFDTLMITTQRLYGDEEGTVLEIFTRAGSLEPHARERYRITEEGYKLISGEYLVYDTVDQVAVQVPGKIMDYRSTPGIVPGITSTIMMRTKKLVMVNSYEESFIREDSVLVQGEKFRAWVFRQESRTKVRHPILFFVSKESLIIGEYTIAEGKGVVEYTNDYGLGPETWQLIKTERISPVSP